MQCRGCGCTDDRACPGGCYWVEPNLCSSCDPTARFERALDDTQVDGDGTFADEGEECPANPMGLHQVLWTGAEAGYCVRCRLPVHAGGAHG